MGIKCEFNNNPTASKPYPKLMKSSTGMIAIMQSDSKGFVIKCLDGHWKVGDYSSAWNMNNLHDYNGTVTLSNE